jgi:fibro-slime domain-containing protein
VLLLLACSDYDLAAKSEDKPLEAGDQRPPTGETAAPDSAEPDTGPPEDAVPDFDACDDGYYAWFYNLPADHPDVEQDTTGLVEGDEPGNHDWWDEPYLSFVEVSPGLEFGTGWWPVDEGQPGDPQYFSVYWEAWLVVDEDQLVSFEMGSDDDGWAYLDGEMVADLGGIHGVEETAFIVGMEQGTHFLQLYMAERHTSDAGFWFRWLTDGVSVFACPE